MKTGVELISEERERQINVKGWTIGHDKKYIVGELSDAALCYAMRGYWRQRNMHLQLWPWKKDYWKPTPENRIRELQKAGALIAAEIDRLNELNRDKLMEKWNPKFYIVYPLTMIDQLEWPDGAPYCCSANLAGMLKFVLNTESIGSEIKLIWNYNHRKIIMGKNNVTSEDIDNYVKADSSILSFMSKKIRDKVKKKLIDIGGNDFIYVDSYRDVILQQAYYYKNKQFKNKEE